MKMALMKKLVVAHGVVHNAARGVSLYALLALAVGAPLAAYAASSANFVMPVDAVNNGVDASASANFNATASVGDAFAMLPAASANFTDKPGFQPSAHLAVAPPAITSVNNVTFTVTTAGTFTVTATGTPIPALSVAGALPGGVAFTPATGVLAGTPALGSVGVYPLVVSAASGTPPNATQNFTLTIIKASQTIISSPIPILPPTQNFRANPVQVQAVTSSGLTAAFTSLTPSVCSVTGGTPATVTILNPGPTLVSGTVASVTMISVGTCTIAADQAGDANYNVAPQFLQTFTISQGTQAITFGPLAARAISTSFTASATTTSGLPVSFTSQTPVTCSASGTNGSTISTLALGTCTLRASQAGNANYAPAAPVDQSFTITQPVTAITLGASPNSVAYAAPITLTASVVGNNPGGTVTFSVATAGGTVVLCNAVPLASGIATCVVPGTFNKSTPINYTATYSGDANNAPLSIVVQESVSLERFSLSATANPQSPVAGQPLTLRATLTGKPLTGTIAFYENGATLPGCAAVAVVTLPGGTDTGIATCVVSALTAGNHTYVVNYKHPNDAGFEQVFLPVTAVASAPLDYTDMWWAGLAENGWGVSITQHGSIQFNVFFVYDAAGKPVFYVMPGGSWNAAQTAVTGALYQPTSSPFSAYDAAQFKPGGAGNAPVGTATFTFTSSTTASVNYTINGVSGSKNIQREIFSGDDGLPRLQVSDLWWGGVEQNGWGINIAQQGRMLFPVWYTYDASGRDTWFAVPGGTWSGTAFTGDIYATTSSAWLGTPYLTSAFAPVKVGTMTLNFSDQNTATMTYTVNGITQTKNIVRQPY